MAFVLIFFNAKISVSSTIMAASGLTPFKAPKMKLGDHVCFIDRSKYGILRYLGRTSFRDGIWAGIEVDDGFEGKHDGSVDSVRYFICGPERGVFVPAEKIMLVSDITATDASAPIAPTTPFSTTKLRPASIVRTPSGTLLSSAPPPEEGRLQHTPLIASPPRPLSFNHTSPPAPASRTLPDDQTSALAMNVAALDAIDSEVRIAVGCMDFCLNFCLDFSHPSMI